MSIILVPTKDDTCYDLLWKAEGCAMESLDRRMSG